MSSSYSYEKKFDVVIVGAGVIGCSLAYFLAETSKGKIKVAVIERNAIGEESSAGAAGMLAAQIESETEGPFLDLLVESRNSFSQLSGQLKELSGTDIHYSESGILSLSFNGGRETILKRGIEKQKNLGLECEWFSPGQIHAKFPFLKAEVTGGFWAARDGQVSASRLVLAFSESAKKFGVQFFENENFDEAALAKPKVNSLETNLSKFVADKFVFSAGSWTGKLLRQAAPVHPVKGQILIYEDVSRWAEKRGWTAPVYIGETPGADRVQCYLVPKRDGHLLVGATMEDRGFDKSENKEAAKKMSQYAQTVFPELSSFKFKSSWQGLRPATPDRMPVMGLVPGFENLYVASGHFRNGILLAPITGKLMAQLLMEGKPVPKLQPFSPDRFF